MVLSILHYSGVKHMWLLNCCLPPISYQALTSLIVYRQYAYVDTFAMILNHKDVDRFPSSGTHKHAKRHICTAQCVFAAITQYEFILLFEIIPITVYNDFRDEEMIQCVWWRDYATIRFRYLLISFNAVEAYKTRAHNTEVTLIYYKISHTE